MQVSCGWRGFWLLLEVRQKPDEGNHQLHTHWHHVRKQKQLLPLNSVFLSEVGTCWLELPPPAKALVILSFPQASDRSPAHGLTALKSSPDPTSSPGTTEPTPVRSNFDAPSVRSGSCGATTWLSMPAVTPSFTPAWSSVPKSLAPAAPCEHRAGLGRGAEGMVNRGKDAGSGTGTQALLWHRLPCHVRAHVANIHTHTKTEYPMPCCPSSTSPHCTGNGSLEQVGCRVRQEKGTASSKGNHVL